MTSSNDTLERLEAGDADFLEDRWLARLDEEPTDVEYFIEITEAAGSVDEELLKSLLRLLDEELTAAGAWSERLTLLSRLGARFLRPNALHEAATESLRALYSDSGNLDEMLRIAGLHQVTQSERKLVQQIERMHSLMELDVGRLVRMEGKGVGRIVDINFELGSYKVDFERHGTLTVGFRAGAKLFQSLPAGHILRRKIEQPESLEQMREEDPSELLREVLVSYDEPLTAAEVRRALTGIVSSSQWNRWWNNARNHPQVVVTTDKRQRYSWAETSDDAAEAVLSAFEAGDLAERLSLFSKNARQSPDLAEAMGTLLAEQAAASVAEDAARALEIWHALSRAGLAADDEPYAPRAIVEAAGDDLSQLAARLSQRPLRELLYREIRGQREDWPAILERCLLAEPDPPVAGQLATWIRSADEARHGRIVDRLVSRPDEHPGAFVWLVGAAREDDAVRRRAPLRLFKQLLAAVSVEAFAPYRSSLEPELESGGTLPKLMADLDDEEASAALTAVKRAILPEYLNSALITALETRFESLRSDAATEALYATRESIEARKQELRELRETEIPATRAAIQEAAALGDLRENFEYKSARQRFEYLSARAAKLQAELATVRVIDAERIDAAEVRIGATVDLERQGDSRQVTVLGPWESAPEKGVISYQSELGERLLGKRPGDTVEFEDGEHTVAGIRSYLDR
ncbi:MAG: GreA/GreB family elongation factor [Thermoanaerobaculia bacterium]|nr:GreA/GreB family elongation factor [Thermoanaerobaculia bacterium]